MYKWARYFLRTYQSFMISMENVPQNGFVSDARGNFNGNKWEVKHFGQKGKKQRLFSKLQYPRTNEDPKTSRGQYCWSINLHEQVQKKQ